MRLSTTPPFVRPTAKTSASSSPKLGCKASPPETGKAFAGLAPPVPAKDGPRPHRHAKMQSQDVTGDASLHKIMDEYRRGSGIQTETAAQPSRPRLLTQDSNFSQMMQVARSASEGTQPAATDDQRTAQERAVRRLATKANAWWQAKVGERRWLGGGRRAGTSAGAVAAAPTGAAKP